MLIYLIVAAASLVALGAGAGATYYWTKKQTLKTTPTPLPSKATEAEASARAKEIVVEAKDEAYRIKKAAEEEARATRREVLQLEQRISQKEESLERKIGALEEREKQLVTKNEELAKKSEDLEKIKQEQIAKLERVAGLTREEAKNLIMEAAEVKLKEEIGRKIKESQEEAKDEADKKVREILVHAMQSSATDYVPEFTTSTVRLPDEDMKGRIIGREGRNIRALEAATGVDFDMDETPGVIRLSCFDPVRREVAKVTLERLIVDGRIQPGRIEEVVEKTRKDVEKLMHEAGEDVAYKSGVPHLPREVIDLLGRFKYRTSYGQNMLQHTLEVVNLAKSIASQVGGNMTLVKQVALLHDIGKAVTAEVEGPHAEVGADIAKRNGLSKEIIEGIGSQHDDNQSSLEAAIVAVADAISGARPGARRESLEEYLKRVTELENVANSFPGVEKCFAIQAGREVRVLVVPAEIGDGEMMKLAHDIAEKIHDTVTYPGQVKVTVVRETRAVDVAK
ncbi:MAG: ribonuclease Y [Patescibacteria group bacterium]|nr:ribonuclease Y [Patescibacteria group bacterium]